MRDLRKIQSSIRKRAKEKGFIFSARIKEEQYLGYMFNIDEQAVGNFKPTRGILVGNYEVKRDDFKEEEYIFILQLFATYIVEVAKTNEYPVVMLKMTKEEAQITNGNTTYEFNKDSDAPLNPLQGLNSYYIDFSNGEYFKVLEQIVYTFEHILRENCLFEYESDENLRYFDNGNNGTYLDGFSYYFENHRGVIQLKIQNGTYRIEDEKGIGENVSKLDDIPRVIKEIINEKTYDYKMPMLVNPQFYFFEKYVIKHVKISKLVTSKLMSLGYKRKEIETQAAKKLIVRDVYWGVQDWNIPEDRKLYSNYRFYYGIFRFLDRYYVFKKEEEEFEMEELPLAEAVERYKEIRKGSKYETADKEFYGVEKGIELFLEKVAVS